MLREERVESEIVRESGKSESDRGPEEQDRSVAVGMHESGLHEGKQARVSEES